MLVYHGAMWLYAKEKKTEKEKKYSYEARVVCSCSLFSLGDAGDQMTPC